MTAPMWFTYILYSYKIDKYYIGYSDNLELRIERHNAGWGKFTKHGIAWILVYYEEFNLKSEAISREYMLKKMKSRKLIKDLIAGGRPEASGSLVGPAK